MKKRHLYVLSALSGILLSLGWPVDGFPFLLFAGFVPLLFVLDHIDDHGESFHKYSLFPFAYLAFFIWNLSASWWIWHSSIIGVITAILLNALFMSIAFLVFHLSKRTFFKNSNAVYLLVFYWITFEFFHLHWDISWPWLNLGNGFSMYTKWVQWYEYTGVFGGSFWVLLMNVLIYQTLKKWIQKAEKPTLIVSIVKAAIVLIVPMIISLTMYYNYEEKGEFAEAVVTQPNVDPYTEQYVLPPSHIITKNLKLADSLISPETDFVLCPESAIQEDIWHEKIESSLSARQIRKFIRKHPHTGLIIGASTFRLFEPGEELTATARKFNDVDKYFEAFNSALYFNTTDTIGIYHKSKLVTGPEKIPLQQYMRPFQERFFDLGGVVGGVGTSKERTVFTSNNQKFKAPAIICYESVYGDFVAGFVRNGANLLFIITNDGWWGNTAGHRLHFALARLRAIETRRAMARSANTGISAFINQRGDIVEKTDYGIPAVLKAKLQANTEYTFYVVFGDFIGRISAFIAVMMLLISFSRSMIQKRPKSESSR
jgi:apolipoprotein N-acyltransferase